MAYCGFLTRQRGIPSIQISLSRQCKMLMQAFCLTEDCCSEVVYRVTAINFKIIRAN